MLVIGHALGGVVMQNDRGKRFLVIENEDGVSECYIDTGFTIDQAAKELIQQWEARYHKKWSPGLMEGGIVDGSQE